MDTPSLHFPLRSRLYNLAPIGVGTPYVECLSGYTARLGQAHSSTLYYLFLEEVAPLINKPGTIGASVSFGSFSKAVNGLGAIAADLVAVFERLTLRQDIRYTTMRPWSDALSSKSLTREERAWCPLCYEYCIIARKEVYDQLIWSIRCVTVCVRHNRRLEDRCSHCYRQQLTLSHRIRPGFCGRCQGWLGNRTAGKTQVKSLRIVVPTEEELRSAEEVGKMLAIAPKLSAHTAPVSFTRNLEAIVSSMFMGRGVPSQIQLPVDKQTIRCWLRGTQTPSLSHLLKTCFGLGISPVSLLRDIRDVGQEFDVGKPARKEHSEGYQITTAKEQGGITLVNWRDEKNVGLVAEKLRAALREDPPVSLTKLAKEIKCNRKTLRQKFPTLTARIAQNATAYYRPSTDSKGILRELQAAIEENPPPSLQEVSRRLGRGASTTILHKKFPEESRTVTERYMASSKRRLDNDFIEMRLRHSLESSLPPSMREVAREIDVAAAVIYRKFPALYREISSRFKTYRRERDRLNREVARAEIKSICERAFREGVYPDCIWVKSQLTVPCQAEAFSKIRREVLAELGGSILAD